jgi:uncharacterized protein YjbI with pentapeptide repeats
MADPGSLEQRDAQKQKKWYERTGYQIPLYVGGIILLVVFVLWLVLDSYIDPQTASQKKDLVQALGLILVGVAAAIGIYFTWYGQQITRDSLNSTQQGTQYQLRLTQQGQLTERFTRAIDQLGSKEIEIRIGGIYALERIARDSERDRSTITQVLSAYIRTKSPGEGGELTANDLKLSSQLGPGKEIVEYQHQELDIQAALDVITGLLKPSKCHEDISERRPLYLNNTDLKFADLRKASLERASIRNANLLGSRLDKSILKSARLRTTILVGARLRDTHFDGADLEEVNFDKAHLQKAIFKKANLGGVTFSGANLDKADLRGAKLDGADLQGATHMTQDQIEWTVGSNKTKLPESLNRPELWSKSIEEQKNILEERLNRAE